MAGPLSGVRVVDVSEVISGPLATMILPQLEQGIHGADVIGMMFFDDNLFCLR